MVCAPSPTKYLIRASVNADGVVEKPDIIGAVFGQTEGLLGNELDMRDLQKSARIGRVEVDIETRGGKTTGTITLPSALDKVESAILAAGLETIDRIGPAKAVIKVTAIEDTRDSRRKQVVDRAKELLASINEAPGQNSDKIADEVRSAVQVAEITKYRNTKLPAGPNVDSSESIIIVEGRNDVVNLLKCGIKNAIAIEGTSVPDEVKELSKYYDFEDFAELTLKAEDVGFARRKTRSGRYIIPAQIDLFEPGRIQEARAAGLARIHPRPTNHEAGS